MMKQFLTVSAAIMGVVLIVAALQGRQSITTPAVASEPPEIAAQNDLPNLIEQIQFTAQDFGFANEEEVTGITLGQPYELYDLDYQNAAQFTPDMQAEQLLAPTYRWEFPVLLNGEAKGMATLGPQDDSLRFVGFSADPWLAQSVVDFQAKHDQAGEEGTVKLFRVFPTYTNFALIQHNEQTNVTLLPEEELGTERALLNNINASQTYELKEVIPQIVQELTELGQMAPTEE
ncbi:MAG: hypothetical protein GFH25_541210n37 [Chloroflexi bacterium AL-N10]|nr:hypothetical protein [Chloroflexi bacterium AL-N1]NOK69610.1 hypothetical protein [Chloroflexi bacterium AL-N10]NOK72157.1 hypothetical protein [Chloroflexi bacterium AL-N5]